ncbi:restriction endonuclease subunit S [Winogradskyella sp. Asnod2-B02-A]|uniref:restriction endonuclease subunit S n=1 Tax=Winogradskyella sp. Asnod2-B02-A TaxID=3160583 RepID=UPI003866D431
MKTYEAYKESGILGVNEVPKDWKIVNFRYLIDILTDFTSNGSFGDLAKNVNYLEEGTSRLVRLTDLRADFKNKGIYLDEASHNYLKKSELFGGEILLANVGAYAGLAWIYEGIEGKASLGPNMFLLKFKDVLNKRFAYISLTSFYLHSQLLDKATSSAQPKLNKEDVKSCVFILPTLKEQTQIANYLDHKTQIIDALIEKKEQLIKKLQAQRQAIINEAVTKGLNPNTKLKDSGIEWLGEIPEHWSVKKIKHEFDNLNKIRVPLSSSERGVMKNKIYDYYGASGVIDKVENYLFDDDNILIGEDGANLLTRSKRLAFIAKGQYWVNNHAHIIHPKTGNINYMAEMLELIDYTPLIVGAAQPKLTQDALVNISIPVPPVKEQDLIMKYLSQIIDKINQSTSLLFTQIQKLKAYRQSIISEAVTGKIDVRDWQAPTQN